MSLFDAVRGWWSPQPSVSEAQKKLQSVLHASVEIVSSFGATLEQGRGSSTPTINQPESDLPYSKEVISQAIAILQQAIKHPRLRTILVQSLSPAEARQVLSAQFEQGLEVGLVLLNDFVPVAEVEAERKQWEDMLRVVEKIDPAARARMEGVLSGMQQGSIYQTKKIPMRDLEKYPNPQDEPELEQMLRLGMRPPDPGESALEWGQNQPPRIKGQ